MTSATQPHFHELEEDRKKTNKHEVLTQTTWIREFPSEIPNQKSLFPYAVQNAYMTTIVGTGFFPPRRIEAFGCVFLLAPGSSNRLCGSAEVDGIGGGLEMV